MSTQQRKASVSKAVLLAAVKKNIKTRANDEKPGEFVKYLDIDGIVKETGMERDSLTTRLSTLRSKLHKVAVAKFTNEYVAANGKEPDAAALKVINERADSATIPQALRGGGSGRPAGDLSDEYSFIDMMTGAVSDDPNPADEDGDGEESDLPVSQG